MTSGAKRIRRCTRTGCPRPAVSTLTYVYADSTAVLGPLATLAEPHCYDLCADHATRLTAPRGWDVVRLGGVDQQASEAGHDDLIALADAVREAARRPPDGKPAAAPQPAPTGGRPSGPARRSHLRILRDDLG